MYYSPSRECFHSLSIFFYLLSLFTWIIGHVILIHIHESATVNAPLIINGAPSLPRGPWSCVCHTPFLDTCSLIFLMALFAAWHASDFARIPYELKL